MRTRVLFWCCLAAASTLCFTYCAVAEEGSSKSIVLWPEGAPGALGSEDADVPTLTFFPAPPELATGAAIVLCPGGGYHHLAEAHGQGPAIKS